MAARQLDRFPTGQATQQLAHERGLADVGRKAANGNNCRSLNSHLIKK
jgi:hypothetical protein